MRHFSQGKERHRIATIASPILAVESSTFEYYDQLIHGLMSLMNPHQIDGSPEMAITERGPLSATTVRGTAHGAQDFIQVVNANCTSHITQ